MGFRDQALTSLMLSTSLSPQNGKIKLEVVFTHADKAWLSWGRIWDDLSLRGKAEGSPDNSVTLLDSSTYALECYLRSLKAAHKPSSTILFRVLSYIEELTILFSSKVACNYCV